MGLQVTLSLAGGGAPIVFGLIVMGLSDLFWVPLFFLVLGISIILVINKVLPVGWIALGVSAVLYVVVHFAEPQWLTTLLERL